MGIEFLQQPPKKTSDVKLSFPFEQTPSEYERDGFDSVWAQLGAADASEIFVNTVEHFEEADYFKKVDYGLLKLILHDAAEVLDEKIRSSYLSGVDRYLDRLEQADVGHSAEFNTE
jgi:hypothetical protein